MDRREHIQDELLVLRAQTGPEHVNALVDRWHKPLWTHAHRMTGDRETAWDIVQESWITIVEGLRRLRRTDAFPAWAFRIVSNRCLNWRRKQGRRQELLADYALEETRQRQNAPSPPGDVDALDAALKALPADWQMLLSLYYEQGFTVSEIAGILGINAGTVKSRLYRARRELKTRMEGMTNDE